VSFGDPVYLGDRPARRAGDVVSALLRRLRFYERGKYGALADAWRAAAGERMVEHTRIAGLERGRLIVEVDEPGVLHELSGFLSGEILERLRATPGGADVAEIRFRLGSPRGR